MPKEQERIPLTAIHINLTDRSIELQAEHGPVAKLTFSPTGTIYFQSGPGTPAPTLESSEAKPLPSPAEPTPAPAPERERTVTLTGRLKNKPQQGKPDRSGNPTAYARFAAHVEGEQGPHDHIATFHRHTARIALGLARDAQITVEGYPHPSGDPTGKRLDTFSVIRLLNYPGRQKSK